VFKHGRRAANDLITVFAVRNDEPGGPCRMGVGVSTRHGGAVRRNRIKRLCREAFRLVRGELPRGWDFMVIPRVGSEFTLEGLMASIRSLARQVTRQAPGKDGRQ